MAVTPYHERVGFNAASYKTRLSESSYAKITSLDKCSYYAILERLIPRPVAQRHNLYIDISIPQYPYYFPIDKELIIAVAERYRRKYRIAIYTSTPCQAIGIIERQSAAAVSRQVTRVFGIIVGRYESLFGHASAYLCCVHGDARKEVCEIDSNGIRADAYLNITIKSLRHHKKEGSYTFMRTTDSDQTDTVSCHIHALVVLRNALLSIKQAQRQGAFTTLWKMVGSYDYVEAPPSWVYTHQLVRPAVDTSQELAVRDLFSSQKRRRASPRTVQQFRQEQRRPVTFVERISCAAVRELTRLLAAVDEASLPPGVSLDQARGVITYARAKNINAYLAEKAFRYAKQQYPHFFYR